MADKPFDEMGAKNIVQLKTKYARDPTPAQPSLRFRAGPSEYMLRADVCNHFNVMVDESLAEVSCRDCGAKLNPIWVLGRMANTECKWVENRKAHIALMEELEARKRCKCKYCGKMTPI